MAVVYLVPDYASAVYAALLEILKIRASAHDMLQNPLYE